MSFLKKIAGAFVEMKEPQKQPDPSKPLGPQMKEGASQVQYENYNNHFTNNGTQQSPELGEMMKHFEGIIDKANLPGADFYEFIKVKEGMSALPIPDETKYPTAFSSLKAMDVNITKQKLLETAQVYINTIDSELSEFDIAFAAAYKTEVEDRKSSIQIKQQKIQELAAQMQALTQEINELNASAMQQENELKANKNSFNIAGNFAKDKIKKEIEKITLLIQ
jgi:hypothetical protein